MDVPDVGHVVSQGQHHDLVTMLDLALVTDGVLSGAPRGNKPLSRSRYGHVAVVGHREIIRKMCNRETYRPISRN